MPMSLKFLKAVMHSLYAPKVNYNSRLFALVALAFMRAALLATRLLRHVSQECYLGSCFGSSDD